MNSKKNNKSSVSVVVTTKNEEKKIQNCLESIVGQTYPENLIELIVVDNSSDDDTKKIALRYTSKVFDIGPERNAQRNYGLKVASTGDFLMWIDADMILSPSVIEDCLNSFNLYDDCVGLFIPEVILGCGFFSRVRNFERSFYNNTVIDGVRFFRKKDFLLSGGFSSEWMHGPDDWDLDKSLKKFGNLYPVNTNLNDKDNAKSLFNNNIKLKNHLTTRCGYINHLFSELESPTIFHDESDFQLIKYLKKKAHYSTDTLAYINKWGKNDPDIKKQFSILYRYFVVFIENGKYKKILSRPNYYLAVFMLRFLVGLVYLLNR